MPSSLLAGPLPQTHPAWRQFSTGRIGSSITSRIHPASRPARTLPQQEKFVSSRAQQLPQQQRARLCTRAQESTESQGLDFGEETFYEGSGPAAELIVSLLLGATLVYLPITLAVIGKKIWFKYKFTNRRVMIINTSPLFGNVIEIGYDKVKEVRSTNRAFGLWGDMVVFLKDGSKLEMTGVDRVKEMQEHVEKFIV